MFNLEREFSHPDVVTTTMDYLKRGEAMEATSDGITYAQGNVNTEKVTTMDKSSEARCCKEFSEPIGNRMTLLELETYHNHRPSTFSSQNFGLK